MSVEISFATHIRPLFRDFDITEMIQERNFDLSKYEDVVVMADRILAKVELGEMPCDVPWSQDRIDLFRQWIADGKRP